MNIAMDMNWFTSSLCEDFEYNNTISANTKKERLDKANTCNGSLSESVDVKPFSYGTISHEHGGIFTQPHVSGNRTNFNGIDNNINGQCNRADCSMPINGILSNVKEDSDESVSGINPGIIHRNRGMDGVKYTDLCNGYNDDSMVADSSEEILYDRKREQKRRPKPKDGSQLLCLICGDRALGYNFDAITCESCKAFFRRNALKTKVFTCSFEGNCKLDPHTRKFCSGCRLKKCVEAGMKKEWILTDDQLAKRRRKGPGQGRLDSYDSMMDDSSPLTETDTQLTTQLPPMSQLHPLPMTPAATHGQKLDMYSPPSSCDDVSTNYMSDETDNSSPGLYATFSPPIVKIEPDKDDFPRPMTEEITREIAKLELEYHQVFDDGYSDEQAKRITEKLHSANDLFNMTDIFIRRLIKFSKHISEFKELKQDDQIHLLKGGIMEIMVLRSAMGFDMQNFQWKVKQAQDEKARRLDPSIIQEQLGAMVYKDHLQFLTSLHQLTNSNKTIMTLLFVIELFSSDRPNINNKVAVAAAQEKFSMWLHAYLESIMSVNEAKQLYPKLLVKLADVRNLGESSAKLASHLDITKLEPLLIEMFSLQK